MGANKSYISVMGMFNYNESLFDDMVIPEALDKETLIDNILLETAELEVVYSNYEFLKMAIGRWSHKELPVWNKLYETTQFEYNPIWNKDGVIKETEIRNLKLDDLETRNLNNKTDASGSSSGNSTGSSEIDISGSEEMKVAAYDSSDYENREYKENDNHNETEDSISTSNSFSSDTEIKDTGTVKQERSDTGTVINARIEQGNIGITTTQQMIREEREVVQFNVMQYIIDSFKRRFCILIY